jgi:hypothetical protein
MDPWLEHPALWPHVHHRFITYASDQLQASVGERYDVTIGERVYVESPDTGRSIYPDVATVRTGLLSPSRSPREGPALEPDVPTILVVEDVERREPFVEIRDAHGGRPVVAVIEILSPTNKHAGAGRDLYLRKQAEVLASRAHLVEIDLIRGGLPTAAIPPHAFGDEPYRVVVSRAGDRRQREVYATLLRNRLPRVAVPLAPPDPDVVLDVQAVLVLVYEKGGFARRVDYAREPVPPLRASDATWARERLLEHARSHPPDKPFV